MNICLMFEKTVLSVKNVCIWLGMLLYYHVRLVAMVMITFYYGWRSLKLSVAASTKSAKFIMWWLSEGLHLANSLSIFGLWWRLIWVALRSTAKFLTLQNNFPHFILKRKRDFSMLATCRSVLSYLNSWVIR